jgi:hypothetical protein
MKEEVARVEMSGDGPPEVSSISGRGLLKSVGSWCDTIVVNEASGTPRASS